MVLSYLNDCSSEYSAISISVDDVSNGHNSLVSTGDTGRQPPLLPPQLAATRVDTIIHNYRLSTSP